MRATMEHQDVAHDGAVKQRRWPGFDTAARKEGVLAILSVTLIVAPADPDDDGELVRLAEYLQPQRLGVRPVR